MKISCKVMEDILPLYVDECCSDDTKYLIKEHLFECDECKETLEKLRQPLFLSQPSKVDEETYSKHVKKAFGKVRRKLVITIVVALLIIIPLAFMGINEVRGEGISYSSLPYVLRGNAMLRSIKNGDYEKAFSYLKLKQSYEWEIKWDPEESQSEGEEWEMQSKKIVQRLLDMGYDGYVEEYKQQWINNFEQLREKGIKIVGYKLTYVDYFEGKYQIDYQLKLNVNGQINNDYGITFHAYKDSFYPGGGSVSGASMKTNDIPISATFGYSFYDGEIDASANDN